MTLHAKLGAFAFLLKAPLPNLACLMASTEGLFKLRLCPKPSVFITAHQLVLAPFVHVEELRAELDLPGFMGTTGASDQCELNLLRRSTGFADCSAPGDRKVNVEQIARQKAKLARLLEKRNMLLAKCRAE